QFMPSLVEQRANCFYRTLHDAADARVIELKVNHSSADTGNVHQIIYQPGQLRHLTLDDGVRALPIRVWFGLGAQELRSTDDGHEWVAKLVTEHRQEV